VQVAIENIGSFKVLEKAGMIREGHSRQLIPLKTAGQIAMNTPYLL
jgi:RimJ/RimL family protein N-acetyltransferase